MTDIIGLMIDNIIKAYEAGHLTERERDEEIDAVIASQDH